MPDDSSLPLEATAGPLSPQRDTRPRMSEPPPVRLVAVEDVRVDAPVDSQAALNEFYGDMLKFNREYADGDVVVFGAENFRLLIRLVDPPVLRDDLRPILIEIPDLLAMENALVARKIDYQRIRRLTLAHASLVLMDPARNFVELLEYRSATGMK